MLDYRAINGYLDRGTKWLVVINVLLRVLMLVTLFTGGLRISDATESMGGLGTIASLDDMPRSISVGEVSKQTRGRAPFRTGRVKKVKEFDELGSFRLIGVSSRGEVEKAYVRDLKLKKVLIKQTGDQLGSYEVADIEKQHIVLRKGSEDFVLRK